jgi:hypothetical protein
MGLTGLLSLLFLFVRGPVNDRSVKVRTVVKMMNECMERMDIKGLRALISEHPQEAMIAANYVKEKYRYVVQSIVVDELKKYR